MQRYRTETSIKWSPCCILHLRRAFGGHTDTRHFRMGFCGKCLKCRPSALLITHMLETADVQEDRLACQWHVSVNLTCATATVFLHRGKLQGFSQAVPTLPSRWIPEYSHFLINTLHRTREMISFYAFVALSVANHPHKTFQVKRTKSP